MPRKKKIVTIGGGSGQYVLLSGLRDLSGIDVTAVVSMVDSGGSTGRLRDELGVLPPGDILKCVIALSPYRDIARKVLQKRFTGKSRLNGHVAGNMLLTILSQYAGNFPEGVKALGEALNIRGRVLPVTTDKATLVAELADGSALYGENVIDVPKINNRSKIVRTFLVPHHTERIFVHKPVIEAIKKADHIIIGPGDLYTSIIPNFLVDGVKEALSKTKANIIYIVNIMTKYGETDGYTGRDFIINLEKAIGRKINIAVFNEKRPVSDTSNRYLKQGSRFVIIDESLKRKAKRIVKDNLLNTKGNLARHDGKKLAKLINRIIKNEK